MYSFEQWCIDNNRKDFLEAWDYELNSDMPNDIGYSTSKKRYFKCKKCGKSIIKDSWNLIHSKDIVCKECNSFYTWCINNDREDIIDSWNEELNGDIKIISKGSGKKCYFTLDKSVTNGVCVSISNITDYKKVDPIKKYKDSIGYYLMNKYGKDFKSIIWSNNNKIDPFEIPKYSQKKITLKCLETDYHGEYDIKTQTVSSDCGCPYCSSKRIHKRDSFGQYLIDNFGDDAIEKYWSEENKTDPFKIAKTSNKKVYLKCQNKNYHTYYVSCANFVNGNRCSYCKKWSNKVHINDSLGMKYPDIIEKWSKKNKKSPFEYRVSSHEKVYFKCENNKHEDYIRIISDYTNNNTINCPECSREKTVSSIQEKVFNYINTLGYTINNEQHCTVLPINPKTKYPMPFDNEIVELKLIIEVHGEQHYNKNSGFHVLASKHNGKTIKECFEYEVWKDNFKKQYALDNGYNYLAISYKDIYKSDNYIDIINEKISQINNLASITNA